jgi:hypothetical protein
VHVAALLLDVRTDFRDKNVLFTVLLRGIFCEEPCNCLGRCALCGRKIRRQRLEYSMSVANMVVES